MKPHLNKFIKCFRIQHSSAKSKYNIYGESSTIKMGGMYMLKFFDLEKSERWLSKAERKQWRRKYKVLSDWLEENEGKLTPIIQLRIKEILFFFFITRRIEDEWIKKLFSANDNLDSANSHAKLKNSIAQTLHLDYVEHLGKYYEKLRKLLQEFEESIAKTGKSPKNFSLAELLEDMLKCSEELKTLQANIDAPETMPNTSFNNPYLQKFD